MKYAIPAIAALAIGALAGCDHPGTTASTTVVREPVVQKEKETVVKEAPPANASSTAPTPSSTTNVTVDTSKPADTTAPTTTETTRSTQRVDTPAGSVTKSETTKTTK